MAVLTRDDIVGYISEGSLAFTPELDRFQLQAHSVDLRLGFTFLVPKSWHITKLGREQLRMDYYATKRPDYFDVVELEKGQFFDLLPGEHILVSSLESVKIPKDLMGVMYPRSSINRKGISVDQTGIIDSGYEGQLVIPIRNNTSSQTVRLYPGERFCQIVFEKLTQKVVARKSRYHQKDIIDGVDVDSLASERRFEVGLIKKGEIRKLKAKYGVRSDKKPTPKKPKS